VIGDRECGREDVDDFLCRLRTIRLAVLRTLEPLVLPHLNLRGEFTALLQKASGHLEGFTSAREPALLRFDDQEETIHRTIFAEDSLTMKLRKSSGRHQRSRP
jgi:hypothetical protein